MKVQKIMDILPITNGLFAHMNYDFRAEISKTSLDVMFKSNYGQRNPSPVVEAIQSNWGEVLTDEELTTLANIIIEMYGNKWDKLAEIYDIEYDPIHNYLDEYADSGSEIVDDDSTSTTSKTTTYGKVDTEQNSRSDSKNIISQEDLDTNRTITDNLTNTETRNFNKTATRTDDLEEEITYGKKNKLTNNLSDATTYGKTDTETQNLSESNNGSNVRTGSETVGNDYYGFNSGSGVDQSGSTKTYNSVTDTIGNTKNNTGTDTHMLSGTDTLLKTGTQNEEVSGSDVKDNSGTQTNIIVDTGSGTVAKTGTEIIVDDNTKYISTSESLTRSDSRTDTLSGSDSVSGHDVNTDDKTTTTNRWGSHRGNIGNLTSQKMILEEINLWKWNYMKEILDDVKEFCTLPIYLNSYCY